MLSRKRISSIITYATISFVILSLVFSLTRQFMAISPLASKCESIENSPLLKTRKNIDLINNQNEEVKYFISKNSINALNTKINYLLNFREQYCNQQSKNYFFGYFFELNKQIIFFEQPLKTAIFTNYEIKDILEKTLHLTKKISLAKQQESNWKNDIANYCSLLSEKEKLFHYFSVNKCRSPSNFNKKELCVESKNKPKNIFYAIDKNIESNELLMAKKWLQLWKERPKNDFCK